VAHSQEERAALAALHLPSEAEARKMLARFQELSGYTLVELGDALGYSHTAICLFLSGTYCKQNGRDENSLKLRSRIKELVEEHPQVQAAIDDRPALETEDYKAVRRAFYKAVDKGLAFCINGDPGTGKTFSLKKLCSEIRQRDASKNGHGRRVIYVRARWNMGPQDLLRRIASAAGDIPSRGSIDQLLRKIRFTYNGRRALIVIDEAQLCNLACLETVRELLDEPPHFGLIFAGSHDVENKFTHIQMEQWRRRLQNAITLKGLSREEADRLVALELGRVPEKFITLAVKNAMAKSVRRFDDHRQPIEYLSAGNLARAIDEVKQQLADRKGANA
jgi:type II secretory pathway predicted ATPase ExeA